MYTFVHVNLPEFYCSLPAMAMPPMAVRSSEWVLCMLGPDLLAVCMPVQRTEAY
jgi:hypothetical protein